MPLNWVIIRAETCAQQGPFESVQHVVSDDTDLETFFDYTQLPQGRFRGKSIIANLTMLTFTGKRIAPHKWNLQFDYERTIIRRTAYRPTARKRMRNLPIRKAKTCITCCGKTTPFLKQNLDAGHEPK